MSKNKLTDHGQEKLEKHYGKKRATIYLVEDQLEVLSFISKLIKRNFDQYDLQVFERSDDFFKFVLEKKFIQTPKLVILDINLPFVSGISCARFVKNYFNDVEVPFLFMSADARYQEDIELLDQKLKCDFLAKPFDPKHLIEKMKAFLPLEEDK